MKINSPINTVLVQNPTPSPKTQIVYPEILPSLSLPAKNNETCPTQSKKILDLAKNIFTKQKICAAAQTTLNVALGVFLYWMNPILFTIGILGGIVAEDKVVKALQKIQFVWQNQSRAMTALSVFTMYLTAQVTLGCGALICGGYVGHKFSQEASLEYARKNVGVDGRPERLLAIGNG